MDDLTTSAQQLSLTSGDGMAPGMAPGMAAAQFGMVPMQSGMVPMQQDMQEYDGMDLDDTALACEQFQQSTALSDMITTNQARASGFNNQLAMVVEQEKNNGLKMKVASIKDSMIQENGFFRRR